MSMLYLRNKPIGAISKVDNGSVSVTADGVKTFAQLFAELNALVDRSKLTRYSFIQRNTQIFQLQSFSTDANLALLYSRFAISQALEVYCHSIQLGATSAFRQFHATQSQNEIQDISSGVATNGEVITLYY